MKIKLGKMIGSGPYELAYGWLSSGYMAKEETVDFYGFIWGNRTFGVNIISNVGWGKELEDLSNNQTAD